MSSQTDSTGALPVRQQWNAPIRDALLTLIDSVDIEQFNTPGIRLNLHEVLEGLGTLDASDKEICQVTGLTTQELGEFREHIDRGRALGNIGIRRMQMRLAMSGHAGMLKTLGEVRLDQIPAVAKQALSAGKANPNGLVDPDQPADTDNPKERLRGKMSMMAQRLGKKERKPMVEVPAPPQPEIEK